MKFFDPGTPPTTSDGEEIPIGSPDQEEQIKEDVDQSIQEQPLPPSWEQDEDNS